MCSGNMSPGAGAGFGFSLDVLGALGQYGEKRKETARANQAIAQQNQLKINAFNTKNRNEANIWNNNKLDLDINTDQKYREAIDAMNDAQLKARKAQGDAAISQQRIMAKMLSQGAREQSGRRSGRGNIAQLGAEYGAVGANAAFNRDASLLAQTKYMRGATEAAQNNYVEYITGRPSPEAPPLLTPYQKGPSFFNTALSIAGAGLNRYKEWKGGQADNPYNKFSGNRASDYMMPESKNPFTPSNQEALRQQPSFGDSANTFELPQFSSPASFTDNQLQTELNDYFSKPSAGESLNFGVQQTFGN